ncbi:MAG TPA: hypothetical protein VNT81_15065 [Vicinamibacterales bacterium]|nr:hypothetical protein [Vicinamibacterales bacterium]
MPGIQPPVFGHAHASLRWLSWPWVAGLLTVLTVGMHAELIPRLADALPADLGDPLLNTWILWWNAQQLPLTEAYWNAPAFAPMTRALALSETLLGLTWLTTPLQWLGASPVAAYNVMYIAEPLLNGLSAYWLCMVLTSRRDAALIGALAFAFAPYHATQVSHIQTDATFFMPAALAALHLYWTTARWRWLAVFGAATTLNALVCGYFLLFFSVLLGIVLVWLTIATRDLRKLGAVTGVLVAMILAISPVILMFRTVRAEYNLVRSVEEMQRNSADATSMFLGSNHLLVWPFATAPDKPELAAYPGAVIVLLIVAGGIMAWRSRQPLREPALIVGLLGLSIATVVVSAAFFPRPYKAISVGLYLAIIAVFASRRFRVALRSASMPVLYLTALVAASALALGPVGRVFGHRFWYKPPYTLFLGLPGFDAARVPALFASIEIVCLAVLAAFAVTRLWPVVSRTSLAATAAIGLLLVVDGWVVLPVVAVPPPPPPSLRADMVIELPAYGWVENVQAMYRGMTHGRPVVNGYSGYVPPHFHQLQLELFKDCVATLDRVRSGRSMDAVIWKNAGAALAIDGQLRSVWPDAIREETAAAIVYHQPRSLPAPNADYRDRCK